MKSKYERSRFKIVAVVSPLWNAAFQSGVGETSVGLLIFFKDPTWFFNIKNMNQIIWWEAIFF